MTEMDDFEKILKKKLEETEFPFDESNWKKARIMIDVSRGNKSGAAFYTLGIIGFLATIGIIYFSFDLSTNKSAKNLIANNNESNLIVKEISQKELITKNVDSKINELISKENSNLRLEIKNTTGKTSASLNQTHAIENTSLNKIKQAIVKKKYSENGLAKIADEEKPEVNKNLLPNSHAEILIGDASNTSNEELSTTINSTTTTASTTNDSVYFLKTIAIATTLVNPVDSAPFQPIFLVQKGIPTSLDSLYKIKHKASILYAEVGFSYLFGWNSLLKHEADGFNFLAGFNYRYYFHNNLSLGLGIQYTTISNLSQSTFTVARTSYDFGIEKEITSIKYLQLHYVNVPFKFGYNIGKNNIIGAGVNFSVLLTDESRYQVYNAKNAEIANKKSNGYLTGFNPYDMQVSIFYHRQLIKGFSINTEFGFGLIDVKDNAHFKNTIFERNMGCKLSLCYNLFKN
ncbi:MAG: hypothetical protein ACK50L_08310 [Bacteroidota bacterium]